jgi:hypothetical protein
MPLVPLLATCTLVRGHVQPRGPLQQRATKVVKYTVGGFGSTLSPPPVRDEKKN